MATTHVAPVKSADKRRDLTNSNAVALSKPLVLLSQHCRGLPPNAASAMLTRFRSPPDTPRTIIVSM